VGPAIENYWMIEGYKSTGEISMKLTIARVALTNREEPRYAQQSNHRERHLYRPILISAIQLPSKLDYSPRKLKEIYDDAGMTVLSDPQIYFTVAQSSDKNGGFSAGL
jgi:hypothetical protein